MATTATSLATGKPTVGGNLPSLLSAPRIIISINNKILAYAIGLNFNINVDVRPVPSLGMFAPVSYEPVMYGIVTGSLQIVRLINKSTASTISSNAAQTYTDANGVKQSITIAGLDQSANNQQNLGVDGFASAQNSAAVADGIDNSILNVLDGNGNPLSYDLDPNNILASSTFDLEVLVNIGLDSTKIKMNSNSIPTSTVATTGSSPKAFANNFAAFTIQNCRLTGRSINMAMSQLLGEVVQFNGLMVLDGSTSTATIKADSL